MAKRGKRYRQAAELVASAVEEAEGPLPLDQAAKLVKETGRAKFEESVDIDIRLGVDPKHADQMVRGSVAPPARDRQDRPRAGADQRGQAGRGP